MESVEKGTITALGCDGDQEPYTWTDDKPIPYVGKNRLIFRRDISKCKGQSDKYNGSGNKLPFRRDKINIGKASLAVSSSLSKTQPQSLNNAGGCETDRDDSRLSSLRERILRGLQLEDLDYLASNFTCKWVEGRGRSLFASKQFLPGDYVIEYKGMYMPYDEEEFEKTEETYEANDEACCVMHVLASDGKRYIIDATREFTYGYARIINHARNPNLKPFHPVKLDHSDVYRIGFYATERIEAGDELFWDYFAGEDPLHMIPTLLSTDNFPKQLLWVYSIRTHDKRVTVQPSALAQFRQTKTVSSKKDNGKENENEINNNDTSSSIVTNRAPQQGLHRKPRICTMCYKVCKKLSTHIQTVHGITDAQERMNVIRQSNELTKTVMCSSSTPTQDATCSSLSAIKGRRIYPCPLCGKVLKKLSSHLTLMHKLEGEKKLCLLRQVREISSVREAELRQVRWRSLMAEGAKTFA